MAGWLAARVSSQQALWTKAAGSWLQAAVQVPRLCARMPTGLPRARKTAEWQIVSYGFTANANPPGYISKITWLFLLTEDDVFSAEEPTADMRITYST